MLKATCFCLVVFIGPSISMSIAPFSQQACHCPLKPHTQSMALYFGAMKGFWWNNSKSDERLDQRDDSLLRRGNTIKWNNLLNVPRFPQHRPLLPLLMWVYDIKRWIKNWFFLIPAAGTTAFMITTLSSTGQALSVFFHISSHTCLRCVGLKID